jgi:hypothetical protein
MIARRRLLLQGTVAMAVVLAARRAAAIGLEELPVGGELALQLAARCGGGDHATLLGSLQAQLTARQAKPGETAQATCPVCGCPVIATAR